MAVIFKYNNKIYQCMNLDKKLKKLRINKLDINILLEENLTKDELEAKYIELTKTIKEEDPTEEVIKYYFKSKIDNSIITSIYSNLDNLKNVLNIEEYERIS